VDEESTIIFYQVLKKRQSIAVSPYLSFQYGYKDWIPTQSYYVFATQAGCPANAAYAGRNSSILQVAGGVFIQQLPSQQLLQKQVNGVNLLSGVKYLSIMFT
jgi:hypothetical protein